MKKMFTGLLLLSVFHSMAQDIIPEKGYDTLFIGATDTLIKLPFKIKGTTIGVPSKLTITVFDGTAVLNKDFALRDEYGAQVNAVSISKAEGKASFNMLVAGDVKEIKMVDFQVAINDNGTTVNRILRVYLAPPKKAAPKEEAKITATAKDSLVMILSNDINIAVYKYDNSKSDTISVKRSKEYWYMRRKEKSINIADATITKAAAKQYNIQVVSTEGETFSGVATLDDNYQFTGLDLLSLQGDVTSQFIHAHDIFMIKVNKASPDTKTATPKTKEIKFGLN